MLPSRPLPRLQSLQQLLLQLLGLQLLQRLRLLHHQQQQLLLLLLLLLMQQLQL